MDRADHHSLALGMALFLRGVARHRRMAWWGSPPGRTGRARRSRQGSCMSGHAYLVSVLAAQNLKDSELQPLRVARDAIERWLRGDIGSSPRMYYGGSYAKGTMLRDAFDLDIVVY